MRRLLGCVLLATVASTGTSLGLAVAGPLPPAAADGSPCPGVNAVDTQNVERTTETGVPWQDLQIREAQDLVQRRTGLEAGTGVTVAVIDSGVPDSLGGIPQVGAEVRPVPLGGDGYEWWTGVAVAGLIAGQPTDGGDLPVGIAPGARVVDVRAYDTAAAGDDDSDLTQASVATLVAALDDVVPLIGRDGVRIVTVAQPVVPRDAAERRAVERAVARVTKAGAIVVTAAGDRPAEGQPGYSEAGEAAPGEDRAALFYPAALAPTNDRVLAVTSAAGPEGAPGEVVPSSAVSVAVPTYGAVSYALTGTPCEIPQVSSGVAAAEVSGVLALLMTYYDRQGERADQVVARLLATAAGTANPDRPDLRLGAGVVQPLDALTRALRPDRKGRLGPDAPMAPAATPVTLPQEDPDLLSDTREELVWWGLVGGLALAAALVLRPVLARRRREGRR